MSALPEPQALRETLEEYSLKLEDYQSKFNPFFSKVSLDLMEKVDSLRKRIEIYANYHRDHQLKHLLESQKVTEEIHRVHDEMEVLHSQFRELERMIRLGQNLI